MPPDYPEEPVLDQYYPGGGAFQQNYDWNVQQHRSLAGGSVTVTGTTGPSGPTGVTGPQGVQGPVGPQGPLGPTGVQGAQGVPGAQGLAGPQGAQGPVGPTGAVGSTGSAGPQGVAGLQGATGPIGQTGPAGVGATGAQGSPGLQGVTGPTGQVGPQGTVGLQGVTGPQGLTGPVGSTGPAGAQGATGQLGPQGPSVTGPTGPAGPQGTVGAQGPQGLQGVTGPGGSTGATGPIGAATLVPPLYKVDATTVAIDLSAYAPLNSPALSGTPTAPTVALVTDNTTKLATTGFVQAAIAGVMPSPSDSLPLMDGTAAAGTSVNHSRGDHVHPSDTSRQPLDADLTSIAGYAGTGAWLYRSAANTWSAVTVGSNLSFTGGTLDIGSTVALKTDYVAKAGDTMSGALVIAAASSPLVVGPNGGGNPSFWVSPAAGAVNGLQLVTNAAGGGVQFAISSPGANENIVIDSKGGGVIYLNQNSQAQVIVGSTLYVGGPATLVGGIIGKTDGSVAASGRVGELLQAQGTNTSVSVGSWTTVATLALSAGDWDVWGNYAFTAGANATAYRVGIGTAANSAPSVYTVAQTPSNSAIAAGQSNLITVNIASGTNYYFNIIDDAATGFTAGASFTINARRRR